MALAAAVAPHRPTNAHLRDFEHPITYLPLPIGLLLGLVWLSRIKRLEIRD